MDLEDLRPELDRVIAAANAADPGYDQAEAHAKYQIRNLMKSLMLATACAQNGRDDLAALVGLGISQWLDTMTVDELRQIAIEASSDLMVVFLKFVGHPENAKSYLDSKSIKYDEETIMQGVRLADG